MPEARINVSAHGILYKPEYDFLNFLNSNVSSGLTYLTDVEYFAIEPVYRDS